MIKKDNENTHIGTSEAILNIKNARPGSTLITSLIAISIILIAVIGTSNFRYYAAMDTRNAKAITEASTIAMLLCESWRGIEGDTSYNPITYLGTDLKISEGEGPAVPSGYTKLGSYLIQLGTSDDQSDYYISYYTTLSYQDIQTGLRALNVNVSWAHRETGNGGFDKTDKSFSLTIYTLTN